MKTKLTSAALLGTLVLGLALPAAAETNATSTAGNVNVDPVCVVNAVTKRDTAIGQSLDAYYNAAKSALSSRTSALSAAWNLTGKDRKAAIKKSWKDYQTAVKSARKNFRTAVRTAWQAFYADRKTCGRGAAAEDSATHGMDEIL